MIAGFLKKLYDNHTVMASLKKIRQPYSREGRLSQTGVTLHTGWQAGMFEPVIFTRRQVRYLADRFDMACRFELAGRQVGPAIYSWQIGVTLHAGLTITGRLDTWQADLTSHASLNWQTGRSDHLYFGAGSHICAKAG